MQIDMNKIRKLAISLCKQVLTSDTSTTPMRADAFELFSCWTSPDPRCSELATKWGVHIDVEVFEEIQDFISVRSKIQAIKTLRNNGCPFTLTRCKELVESDIWEQPEPLQPDQLPHDEE